MPLAGCEIKKAINSGAWKAWRDGDRVGSGDIAISINSVDVTLGPELLL